MTSADRRPIMFIAGTDVVLFPNPVSSMISDRGKLFDSVLKQPDAAFKYGGPPGPDRNGIPLVMFEVVFSQSYEFVLEVASHWLVQSKGAYQLCVIVEIFKQPNTYNELDYTRMGPKLQDQQCVLDFFAEAEAEAEIEEETGYDDVSSLDASIYRIPR